MNDGDFIKIDYEMRTGEDKKLVATNNEELAKKNDIYNEESHYGPSMIIVGSDNLLTKVNESFLKAQKGKEVVVSMSAEEAFGNRDPKNIKVHTYREFQRNNIDPVVGNEVMLNNRRGRVLSVTPGRVLVDYNHQWAGRKVEYKYTVVELIENDLDRVKALVDMYYAYRSEQFEFKESKGKLDITIPETSKFDPAWIEAKFEIVTQARKYLKDRDIFVIEKYEKPPEEKKEEPEPEVEKKAEEKKPAPKASAKTPAKEKKEEEAKPKTQKKAPAKKAPAKSSTSTKKSTSKPKKKSTK